MAVTSYGTNAPEAVKLWSRKLFREALKNTSLANYIGSDSNSVIQVVDDTSQGKGDKVTMTLRMQLAGEGVEGDDTLEGQEESLVTFTDSITINQLRHAVRSGGRVTEQRIPFSVRKEAQMGLADWWADRIDTALFNQLGGYTPESRTKFTGMQAVTAYDSDHRIFASGTTDEGLTATSSHKMSLTIIDKLVQKATVLSPSIRPLKMAGEPYWLMFLHPYQVFDLRTNTDTGQWLDIQKAAMNGGKITGNPIFTGALGVYNRTILIENTRVPQGVNSSTGAAVSKVRRAIFCGAQAAGFATGREDGPDKMTWVEELFDYKNQLGVSAGMIWGAKRTIFNSESFGSMIASTHAVAAS